MNAFVGILAAVIVALGVLTGIFILRMEAAERDEQERRRVRLQLAIQASFARTRMCAIHGHRYLLTFVDQGVQVWRCGACGDLRDYDHRKDGAA